MFKIKKLPEIHESHDTKASKSNFPIWLQGQWQFLNVAGNQLIFKDHSSFKSYRMTLLNQLNDDKFIVSSRSQCGEEDFKCLWIRKLDVNILEFQTSSKVTKTLTNSVLCNEEEYFDNNRWLTQSSKFVTKFVVHKYLYWKMWITIQRLRLAWVEFLLRVLKSLQTREIEAVKIKSKYVMIFWTFLQFSVCNAIEWSNKFV